MIPRVLEPEAMDTVEEAIDYDGMDHSEVNARFVADFLKAHGPCRGGDILDVGTGPARIPIALCQADSRALVLGIDLAEAMLVRGRENVNRARLWDRIRLSPADAKAVSLGLKRFEAVVSNTIIHHIPEPAVVFSEILRLVEPGGTVMVRDLYRPDDLETVARLVETHAGQEQPPARALFEASLRAALTLDEARAIVSGLGVPEATVSMTSDRHWTWLWRRPV